MDIIIVHIASFISDKKTEAFYSFIAWPTWKLDVIAAKYSCKRTVTVINANRPKSKQKNMCVYSHMSKKNLGSVGIIIIYFFLLSAKPEIIVPGISFSIFPVTRHLLKLFYDELRRFSTFFALNFDKKLAVE